VRGGELRELVERVRAVAAGVVVSVDVNGADAREEEEGEGGVLGAVLPVVDLLHANLEEACVISGRGGEADGLERAEVEAVVRWLCRRAAARGEAGEVGSGAGIVCVTCGRDGVFAGRCGANGGGGRVSIVHRRAFALADGVPVNSSGAGDAFAAGAVAGLLNVVDTGAGLGEDALALVADAGLASARACLDAGFREVLRGRCHARGRFSLPDALMRLPSRFG
jgi:sugar/nucleoside kinase (ribokinase family)